jgi:hypothetical protein
MNTKVHQGWGLLGMFFATGGVFGALLGLAFDLSARTRHGFLAALFLGIALIFAALRAGRMKA